MKARLQALHHDHGRTVSLVGGGSLGGIFARELAREFPSAVRQVITLGSPIPAASGRPLQTPTTSPPPFATATCPSRRTPSRPSTSARARPFR